MRKEGESLTFYVHEKKQQLAISIIRVLFRFRCEKEVALPPLTINVYHFLSNTIFCTHTFLAREFISSSINLVQRMNLMKCTVNTQCQSSRLISQDSCYRKRSIQLVNKCPLVKSSYIGFHSRERL